MLSFLNLKRANKKDKNHKICTRLRRVVYNSIFCLSLLAFGLQRNLHTSESQVAILLGMNLKIFKENLSKMLLQI